MFVNAPRLLKNGTLRKRDRRYRCRTGLNQPETYPTIDAAFAAARKGGVTYLTDSGLTKRDFMQKGIVAYKRYKDTQYACTYKAWETEGAAEVVTRKGVNQYLSESFPVLLGDTDSFTFSGSWVIDNTNDIDPKGSRSTVAAVSSRALLLNMRNRITSELLTRAGAKSVDLGIALATADKSLLMVATRMRQVLRAWRELRRRNLKGLFEALGIKRNKALDSYLNDLPRLWLELQYGWMPLLNDIYGGALTVQKMFSPSEQPRLTVTRRGFTELFIGDPTSKGNHFLNYEFSRYAIARGEMKVRFQVVDSFSVFLNSIGLTNPLLVAWDLVPYSFVLDWLLPVSTILEACTATLGLKFVGGYYSTVTYGEQSVKAWNGKAYYPYPVVARRGTTTSTAKALFMNRDPLGSWPQAAPYFRLPFSSNQRVANALALLSQQRRMR